MYGVVRRMNRQKTLLLRMPKRQWASILEASGTITTTLLWQMAAGLSMRVMPAGEDILLLTSLEPHGKRAETSRMLVPRQAVLRRAFGKAWAALHQVLISVGEVCSQIVFRQHTTGRIIREDAQIAGVGSPIAFNVPSPNDSASHVTFQPIGLAIDS